MHIGSLSIDPPTFLAPMAAVSDLPFRRLCRAYGVGLVTTELISINGLVLGRGKAAEKSRALLRTHPAERPRGVQLFGSDPELVAEAAQLAVEEGADLIDFNMGCPVAKVCKLGAGAALLKDPAHAARLVEAAARAVRVPVTAKIRAGWSEGDRSGVEVARRLVDAGAQAIAVHARTRTQGFNGRADWTIVREIKSALSVPVIGNGDVFTPEDALRMVRETGCDGVMLGRGAMGLPMVFREVARALGGEPYQWPPTVEERRAAFLQHLALSAEELATSEENPRAGRLPLEMRNHLLQYTRGLPGAAQLRAALGGLHSADDYQRAAEEVFASAPPEARPSTSPGSLGAWG
jgi:nifR3 family TIM-barrel protein